MLKKQQTGLTVGCIFLLAACSLNAAPTTMPNDGLETTIIPLTETPVVEITTEATQPAQTLIPVSSTPTLPPLSDQFFGSLIWETRTTTCDLPCWNGIQVGSSTLSEAQTIMNKQVELQGYIPEVSDQFYGELPEELLSALYSWDLTFNMWLIFDSKTEVVRSIHFLGLETNAFEDRMSVKRIITELGEPDQMVIALESSGAGGVSEVRMQLLILYQEGISFVRFEDLPIIFQEHSDDGSITLTGAEFCLASLSEQALVGVNLTEPISGDLSTNLFQYHYPGNNPEALMPIQNVTGLTLAEISQLATEQRNPCLRFNINH